MMQLWSRAHSDPVHAERWAADDLLQTDRFDEFVGTCFDVATLL